MIESMKEWLYFSCSSLQSLCFIYAIVAHILASKTGFALSKNSKNQKHFLFKFLRTATISACQKIQTYSVFTTLHHFFHMFKS